MQCPSCNTALQMAERSGIEIDYCPSCRGVWLDRGELDKIIERSAEPVPHALSPSPQWNERPRHGGHAPYDGKRKKSFLEQLFD